MREKEAKSRECFLSRNTRRTLVAAATDAAPMPDVASAEARADEVVISASDAMASNAGQTLCSVRWLCDVNSFFEPSCAPDAVASVDPPSNVSLDAY
jgi:hypothetical protein